MISRKSTRISENRSGRSFDMEQAGDADKSNIGAIADSHDEVTGI